MQFDNSYFQDEIREGFYIPGMIKRSWAMQLEVLQKIDEICEKHGIRWFADSGTLIGAVRHRGFIPWDDDLDICMLRDDYIKFNEVIKRELPTGYMILNMDTDAEYDNFLTRIIASDAVNIANEYLMSHHGFPYIAGVDVFPLDYLYSEEEREEARRKAANTIWNLTQSVKDKKERRSEDEIRKFVSEIAGYSLDASLPVEAGLSRVLEKIFSECRGETSDKVTVMPFYVKDKNYAFSLKWYERTILLPFENGYIKVPAAYGEILKVKYGKWYVTRKHCGTHEYPYYTEQEDFLLKHKGTAPYYYVYGGMDQTLREARREHAISADKIKKLITSLEALHGHIVTFIGKRKNGEAAAILEKCQELAITVGTAIEEEQGEGLPTVKHLEDYCELVYDIHERLLTGATVNVYQERKRLAKLYAAINNSYDNDIPRRREILLVPIHAKGWDYMTPLYERYASEEDTDVYVMPAVFAERSNDGSMLTEQTDYDSFPDSLPLVRPEDFDLGRHHPDVIVIQNPFDEYESGFTVHPYFYASNLYKYTDKLVYCQSFSIDDIEEDDEKALVNALKFVVTPGVMLSDEIYVPNENMKSVYLELISSLIGIDRKEWDGRIKILPIPSKNRKKPDERKPFLFFHVGDGDYITYEKVFEKIRHSMELFAEAKEKLDIVWAEETTTADNIKNQSQKLYEEYEAVKKEFADSGIGNIIPMNEAMDLIPDAAGYYGSAGYLMNLCVRAGIPAMIWEIS